MRIREILDPRHMVLDIEPATKREILTKLSAPLASTQSSLDHARLVDALVQREETSSTAIADGIAIPHGKLDLGDEVLCAFGRSPEGVDFDSIDGKPTHIFFLLVSPESQPSLHLRWLAHLAVLLKSPALRRALVLAGKIKECPAVEASLFVEARDDEDKGGLRHLPVRGSGVRARDSGTRAPGVTVPHLETRSNSVGVGPADPRI